MARFYRNLFYRSRRRRCAYCEGEFRAHRCDARYCSDACRQAASRARRCGGDGPVHRRTRIAWARSARILTPDERDQADKRTRQETDE